MPAESEVLGRALNDPVASLGVHAAASGLDGDRPIIYPEGARH